MCGFLLYSKPGQLFWEISEFTKSWGSYSYLHYYIKKVKVVPYTFVRREVPVREGTYLEPSPCELEWSVRNLLIGNIHVGAQNMYRIYSIKGKIPKELFILKIFITASNQGLRSWFHSVVA